MATIFRSVKAHMTPFPKIEALILDWSGTLIDAHVIAPAVAFVQVFKDFGLEISMPEARKPMGLRKDLHIAKILEDPKVAQRWTETHPNIPINQKLVDDMFDVFVPTQLDLLPQYCKPIPGIPEVVNKLQNLGYKLGATTGFTREMVEIIKDETKHHFKLDCDVAGDDILHGVRPYPHMVYENMRLLGVHHPSHVIKIDDTLTGVGEGLNARCVTGAVTNHSTYTDIDSIEQWDSLNKKQQWEHIERSKRILHSRSNAHFIVDDLTSICDVLEQYHASPKNDTFLL